MVNLCGVQLVMMDQNDWNTKMFTNGSILDGFGVSGHQSGVKFHEESIRIGPGAQNCHESLNMARDGSG